MLLFIFKINQIDNMEELLDTRQTSLDKFDTCDDMNYRLSIFDQNCHFIDEIQLSEDNLRDLYDFLKEYIPSLGKREFE